MAGWISSKLKVAESLLQQIDQQAAESLGKNERSPSPSESPTSSAPKRSSSALPLKYQLPTKPPPPPSPPIGTPSLPDPDPDDRQRRKQAPDLSVADGDWTELLGSPKTTSPPSVRSNRTPPPPRKSAVPSSLNARKGLRIAPVRPVARTPPFKEPASPVTDKGDTPAVAEKVRGGNTPDVNDQLRAVAVPDNVAASSSGSDTGSDSGSSTDSEDERRRREERRKRRERMIAERVVEAIKERENVVARLEGEKQSLEKILEEAQRQQAQEASELQTSMIETMDAVELEKQKHNSTRMEALARLANLETTNTELARELATTQWNLEVEVTRVTELRQQIEAKEMSLEEHRRRMSKTHQDNPSLAEVESSKKTELEHEILDAEYSLVYDKIAKLKEKARKLEENIVITRFEITRPTEVEIELKRRLAQLTDHLIQKQTQSSEILIRVRASLLHRHLLPRRLQQESTTPPRILRQHLQESSSTTSSIVDARPPPSLPPRLRALQVSSPTSTAGCLNKEPHHPLRRDQPSTAPSI